jgi:hypothetical protein
MASSSSSAHRVPLDLEPVEFERPPDEHAGPICEYFGDDAPTLELLLPTTLFELPASADRAAPTPMARLRLQRRQVKRDDPDRDDD